jgi:hypothetical protein
MVKILKIAGINVIVFLGLLLLLEGAGQIVAKVRPSYDVLYLQPDPLVGWKQPRDLRFTWTGFDWYAAEFSVDVRTSPQGFRDIAREIGKAPGVMRIAVLGDSFIEALQVPMDLVATQVLERRLNASPPSPAGGSVRWEVLNFGVSNHGVGQYLLMWENYARAFKPDYVVIFVAKFHMRRTVNKYEYRAFSATRSERLWVRPTFRLDNGVLMREPARDFELFVKAQDEVVQRQFDGARTRPKPFQLVTVHYARILWDEMKTFMKGLRDGPEKSTKPGPGSERDVVELNLRVIEALGRSVAEAGARLVVVDASQYFEEDPFVARDLRELSAAQGYGYVPVYQNLREANAKGVATRWVTDTHFNEAGNAILAASIYDWIVHNGQSGKTH